jgi:hypothetical protein
MTPRITPAADLAYLRYVMDAAAEIAGDGRPSVGAVDHLLEALRAAHGPDGRPDIAPETIPRPRRGQP